MAPTNKLLAEWQAEALAKAMATPVFVNTATTGTYVLTGTTISTSGSTFVTGTLYTGPTFTITGAELPAYITLPSIETMSGGAVWTFEEVDPVLGAETDYGYENAFAM